jgi:hypothetical protein
MNMGFVGFSYGHAIFASINTSCITIVDVFIGINVSPPLCRYGYYNDQIYYGVTAALYSPMHALCQHHLWPICLVN